MGGTIKQMARITMAKMMIVTNVSWKLFTTCMSSSGRGLSVNYSVAWKGGISLQRKKTGGQTEIRLFLGWTDEVDGSRG